MQWKTQVKSTQQLNILEVETQLKQIGNKA